MIVRIARVKVGNRQAPQQYTETPPDSVGFLRLHARHPAPTAGTIPGTRSGKPGIVRKRGHFGCPILTDVDMIPIGAAATLLSDVRRAISSGLSELTGQSSTGESSQPSFAVHLKAASSQSGIGKNIHHHHAHGALSASAKSSPSPSQTTVGSGMTAVGSIINISA